MKHPQVTIVVLNYNGLEDTLACLDSLAVITYPNYKVVVVDNGSRESPAATVRRSHPLVTVLETGENLGYAEGNNVGLHYALCSGSDYVLLLNNDTVVAPDFLTYLVDAVETDPDVGIAGPTIYYFARSDIIWSAGGAIDWRMGVTTMVGLDEVDVGQFGASPRPVDFVTGCALLIRQSVVNKVGLLDARFFMYFEENEWCFRVGRAGYKVVHVPQAKIWHKISPVQQHLSPHVHYYMTRNRLLFLQLSGASWRTWIGALVFGDLRTLLSWSLRPRWRHMRSQRQVMLRAILDYWLGRFGRVDLNLISDLEPVNENSVSF